MDFSKAIDLNQGLAEALSNRAICRFHQKRYAAAMEDVRRFQQLGGHVPPEFVQAVAKALAN